MKEFAGILGQIGFRKYEDKEVLREVERQDPVGEIVARRNAFWKTLKESLPSSYELVAEGDNHNAIGDAWYDLIFDTMLRGDAFTENVRMSVFGNDVTPATTLTITTFEASLGEVTTYTVDGGNTTNRATTTFAASASQSITNSAAPSRFTFTATDTVYGGFMTQGATLKDGTQDVDPAVYIAGGKFAAAQPVANASIIDLIYGMTKA